MATSPRGTLLQTLLVGAAFSALLFKLLVDDGETHALIEFQSGATAIIESSRRESEVAVEVVEELAAFGAAPDGFIQHHIAQFLKVEGDRYPHFVYGLVDIGATGAAADILEWIEPSTPFLRGLIEELRTACAAAPPGSRVQRVIRTGPAEQRVVGLYQPLEGPAAACAVLVIPSGAGVTTAISQPEFVRYRAFVFVADDPEELPWLCLAGGSGQVACPAPEMRRHEIESLYTPDWHRQGRLASVKDAPILVVVPHEPHSIPRFVEWNVWLILALAVLATLVAAVLRYRIALNRVAIARSDMRYRALIDATPIGVVGWDNTGAILDWNPAAERLLGWTREESVGAQVADRLLAVTAEPLLVLGPPAALVEGSFQERTLQRADGSSVLAEVLVRATEFEHGWQFSALIRDVTALRAAEASRQHVERLVGAATLASGFAHDFNNLLTVITGNLEFVAAELAPDAPAREDLAAAQNAAARASEMVRSMLHGARRRDAVVTATRLDGEIVRLQNAMKQVLGARVVLRLDLGAGAACVEVDINWFESALLDVLLNARHAMSAGGTVLVATRVEQRRVVIEVTDSGSGMTPEVAARAFEPFFTTKPEGVGNGLGLSMVRSFARTYGGEVELESTVGQGTTVRIRLAVAASSSDSVNASPQAPV